MEQIRAFIAIELPSELKNGLYQLETELKRRQSSARWVDPENIHLTLNFLGNIDAAKTGEITEAMEEAAQGIPPFQLEVKELGVFPNLKRVQVVWVGISGEVDKLMQLQQGLETNLAILGFAPEERKFTPHLTLARVRNEASFEERQKLGQLIASTQFEGGTIRVDAISLMRSELTRAGPIYTRLSLVKLGGQK
ncbi:MAG: RNA 2',3'-cyclic phosphodiesterase [Chloroflexi bacterium]|nr:RNA 2',3'-cyclic phosphodiesterase [Chloroflexota bacterium]